MRRKNSLKMAKYLKKNMMKIATETLEKRVKGVTKVPNECSVCQKPFDKTDREQVFSWMLRVPEQEGEYELFCPPCFKEYFPDQSEVPS